MLGKKEVELNLLKNFFRFLSVGKWTIVMFARQQVLDVVVGVNRVCQICKISRKTLLLSKRFN
jgi:hypothetical protein